MTDQERTELVSGAAERLAANSRTYAYDNLECHKSHIDAMLQSEAGRVLFDLFDQYSREATEGVMQQIEDRYHELYAAKIEALEKQLFAIRFSRQYAGPYHKELAAQAQVQEDAKFIAEAVKNCPDCGYKPYERAAKVTTKDQFWAALNEPLPKTCTTDMASKMPPKNQVKIEDDVAEFKRAGSGKTLLEQLYPDLYL